MPAQIIQEDCGDFVQVVVVGMPGGKRAGLRIAKDHPHYDMAIAEAN